MYKIKTLSSGYKVLCLDGVVAVDEIEDISAADFDAVYVEYGSISPTEIALILQKTSPFVSKKCRMKPRFISSRLKERSLSFAAVIDGYVTDINDPEISERIEGIYYNLSRMEFYEAADVSSNPIILFLKLCKYALSRNMITFTSCLIPGYSEGFSAIYQAISGNTPMNVMEQFARYIHILEDLEYIEKTDFIERVHLCPECGSSHLLYMECCPKCHSSHIKQESVIHHFRCANISPESTYAYDGEYRCPKCHHILRHIGVDYDRPANIHTCQKCSHTFINTQMKVICTHCNKTMTPADLTPMDIYRYRFTPDGIAAISSNEATLAINRDIWKGYSKFSTYLSQIQLLSYSRVNNKDIFISRFKIEGDGIRKDIAMDILEDLQHRYHYNNFSYDMPYIYMASKISKDTNEETLLHIKEEIENIVSSIEIKYGNIHITDITYFHLKDKERINSFIKQIKTTKPLINA